MRDAQVSHLLRLPAEIRNDIYAYTLSREVFQVHCWRRYTPFSFETRIIRKQKNFLALLAVCTQLYDETRLFPFMLNAFQFKSQDAFHPWLIKFSSHQQEAIQEVHVVTWTARHMVEGEGWCSKPLKDVLPVATLRGLRRVLVEVRHNGRTRECLKEVCPGCERHGGEVALEEKKCARWLSDCIDGVQVTFERMIA
ncbi:hypothetical protein HBI38_118350 [Parastagonospora nodorum]|nr:hypothetical protein HBI73_091000 [Parastagonospora nodorum]KAH5766040.1 hypothetical protein HBI97_173440 [Parastagonospora nodorum]KAH5797627.1 hypothetical protein HBI96_166330 [Parastagonospora nodorum]KAH5812201.1 hypothetical protein HBI94_148040 [Parastagonospora nodorum]KAH5824954.1 hypothetical protein HBI93_160560 [Parastagonospora nodorum]